MERTQIYEGWSPDVLQNLWDQYTSSRHSNESYATYLAYKDIPLGRIAERHEVELPVLTAFVRWLGTGIGEAELREDMTRLLQQSEVLNPDSIKELAAKDELIADLLEFAVVTNSHEAGESKRVDQFISQPMEVQVKAAQRLIRQVLDNLET